MRIPENLATLFEYGVLEDVVRPLMSGKEAQVYLVVASGKYAVAKIYKEAQNRTFKHRSEYTEGRKVRNTRDQRAIDKRSKHGRRQDEAAWRSTEVDMIHRLHAGGVRVPVPYHYIDGVLIMELITDANGNPAPRLGDVGLDRDAGVAIYDKLVREVVRMLCAGVVHGDLSEFNVLLGGDGPVIIDFPQSVDSAHNTNARRLLVRDVDNLHRFLRRVAPSARTPPYAQEMWNLYEQNLLTPETRLRGDYRPPVHRANTASVLELIDDANRDERKRREALGFRGSRGPAPAPAAPAKRKEAPVYQGLPNQGLSSFRGHRSSRNEGQRGQAPRHDGQRPQGAGPHAQQGRPAGNPAGGRPPARPEVERIHVRPRDPERRDAPLPRDPVAPAAGRHERREEPSRDTQRAIVHPPNDNGAQPQRRRVIRSVHTPDRSNGSGRPKVG